MDATETRNARSIGLDAMADDAIVGILLTGQERAVAAVGEARPALVKAAHAIVSRVGEAGRLIYVGAGSSGRIAALDGMELGATFGWPEDRTIFLLAGGYTMAPGMAGSFEDDAERARAEMVLLKPAAVDIPIFLDTGAEVIVGSTRMGAGTAQKAALGILSSLVMIRLGHVYDGFMVDLRADNAKLRRRALQTLSAIAGCGEPEAADALDRAGGNLKKAALVLRGLAAADAGQALAAAGGNLRTALERLN